MKILSIFALSTVFQLSLLASRPQPVQNRIPPEVQTLVDELKENLNAGELLQNSANDVVEIYRTMRHFMPANHSNNVVTYLTDEEIMDFVTSMSNMAMICAAYIHSNFFVDSDSFGDESTAQQIPSSCVNFVRWRSDSDLETKNEVMNFLAFIKAQSPSLIPIANTLVTSPPYYESAQYIHNAKVTAPYFGETEETIRGPLRKDVRDRVFRRNTVSTLLNLSSLKNADLYRFNLSAFVGLVAFENDQARLILLIPVFI